MGSGMSQNIIVKYVNGVLTPEEPVSLLEETRFLLVPLPEEAKEKARPEVGSKEAQLAFIEMCRNRPLNTGMPIPKRDELYERF